MLNCGACVIAPPVGRNNPPQSVAVQAFPSPVLSSGPHTKVRLDPVAEALLLQVAEVADDTAVIVPWAIISVPLSALLVAQHSAPTSETRVEPDG